MFHITICNILAHQLKCLQCKGNPPFSWPKGAQEIYLKYGGAGICDNGSTGESTHCRGKEMKKYLKEHYPTVYNQLPSSNETICLKGISIEGKIDMGCGFKNNWMEKNAGFKKINDGKMSGVLHWCSSDDCNGKNNTTSNCALIIWLAGFFMVKALGSKLL